MTQSRQALRRAIGAAGTAALGLTLVSSAVGPVQAAAPRAASVSLAGSGSTFVQPIMQGAWIPGYTKMHSNVQINYQGVGSGQGISNWTAGTTDFAASDALLKKSQDTAAAVHCGAPVTKIPVTIGAVALIYNLPGLSSPLKLTPDVVARIYLGQITSWNDAKIKSLNAGLKLPSLAITPVHRSDGSGTTYIFSHEMAAVNSSFKSQIGSGSTLTWPVGVGAAKSSGVSAAVKRTAGAISYVDLAYAFKNSLSYAWVQNKAGKYVAPGVDSAGVAANSFAASMPSDLQQVIVNSSDAKAYPIVGFSYIFLCSKLSGSKAATLVDFVKYVVTAGQAAAKSRYYAPLPKSIQDKDVAALKLIKIKM